MRYGVSTGFQPSHARLRRRAETAGGRGPLIKSIFLKSKTRHFSRLSPSRKSKISNAAEGFCCNPPEDATMAGRGAGSGAGAKTRDAKDPGTKSNAFDYIQTGPRQSAGFLIFNQNFLFKGDGKNEGRNSPNELKEKSQPIRACCCSRHYRIYDHCSHIGEVSCAGFN